MAFKFNIYIVQKPFYETKYQGCRVGAQEAGVRTDKITDEEFDSEIFDPALGGDDCICGTDVQFI